MLQEGTVSAVIPVVKDSPRLDKAIAAVRGQVNEVVISGDGKFNGSRNGCNTFPGDGTRTGFGATCNRGARYSTGEWILFLNDDCYLAPDAVSKMFEVATSGVAAVGCLTRYPDGTIYHGGTRRQGSNFGHIDHGKTVASITKPTEMEFVNFAAALVRRSAFYEVGAFDSRFDCYSEDADLCLKLREAGWKVVYQPHATGIHEEGKSTSSDKQRMLAEGAKLLADKWFKQ
jgi:GT2 family glycosyltransferase